MERDGAWLYWWHLHGKGNSDKDEECSDKDEDNSSDDEQNIDDIHNMIRDAYPYMRDVEETRSKWRSKGVL